MTDLGLHSFVRTCRNVAASFFVPDLHNKKVNVAVSGYNMELLKAAIRLLEAKGTLPQEYRPHKLPWQLRRHLGMPYQGRLADALAAKRHQAYASFHGYRYTF